MRTIEELRDDIESFEELIKIAEVKRDKYLFMARLWNSMDGINRYIRTGKVKEFLGEYDRMTEFIEEMKVEVEDIELIIERIETSSEKPVVTSNCYIVFNL